MRLQLLVIILFGICLGVAQSGATRVRTEHGWVRGIAVNDNVTAFLGVPFAGEWIARLDKIQLKSSTINPSEIQLLPWGHCDGGRHNGLQSGAE